VPREVRRAGQVRHRMSHNFEEARMVSKMRTDIIPKQGVQVMPHSDIATIRLSCVHVCSRAVAFENFTDVT
jgi:hypothetical protein